MKLQRVIITILALLTYSWAEAQSFSLSGKILDEDGHGLPLATVSCQEQHATTIANIKGEYSLHLKSADSVKVRFSMIGYQTKTRTLRRPKGRQRMVVTLYPATTLNEVVVTQQKRQTNTMQQLKSDAVRDAPSTAGNGIEELVQQQAGVSTHNELSSRYNVRGGSFDENSVYLNGTEIYRPILAKTGQHEGLSIINSDLVDKIGFSSGGYEAKYGGKMSSVLDITYRRPQQWEGNIQASLLGGSAYVGYGNKHFSMSHGLRYKTNRYLLGSLETKGEYKPRYLDYQTYLSWRPNQQWEIEALGDYSENRYHFTPTDRETSFGTIQNAKTFKVYFDGQERDLFRTATGMTSVSFSPSNKTIVRLQGSAFHTREQERYDIQGQYWLDDTQTSENLGVGTYREHARNYLTAHAEQLQLTASHRNSRHHWEAGFTMKWEHVKEQSKEYEMRDSSGYNIPHKSDRLDMIYSMSSRQQVTSTRTEAYLQDQIKWQLGTDSHQSYCTLNIGLRWARWNFNSESTLSPRLSFAIIPAFNTDMTFRLATGIYYQSPFYKEMRDTTTANGVTTVALNSHIKSQRSIHIVGGFDYQFRMLGRPFRFTAEAYYKKLDHLIPYNMQNMKIVYEGNNIAKGHATGIDFKLFGEFVPGTDSWLTLSLMSTQQDINGISTPLPTDQRWGVNLHFTDYFPGTERWKMTLRLAFTDGLPFGAPHRGLEQQQFRAPSYKRADIGMNYLIAGQTSSKRKGLRHIWLGIDLLNVFGTANVSSYYWVTDVTNQQYAVPNYLTGRQINGRITIDF